jgi:eukaryotic-like serine/threonine-protein kinase
MNHSLEDPRAYLQQRVALFTGVAGALFAAMLVLDFFNSAEGEATFSSTRVSSLAVVTASALVWWATRKGLRSATWSRALELFVMAVMAIAYGTLPANPPIPGAGPIIYFFVLIPMAVAVLLRAAIIPSPAWLSALVTLVWGAIMTGCGVVGWDRQIQIVPAAQQLEIWELPLIFGTFATVCMAVVAGIISHIVHGLQTKVREAMQLGQYTLEWKIGEGGMGAVYRAKHRLLRRPTAVKLLPPDKAGEMAIARFEQEVQQTCRLTHPNTVAIFDFGRTDDGVFYYAMEYLDGITLQSLVDDFGPLPPGRAIHVLTQVAGALAEAHGMGLVHRDIKPDNVILCERGGAADVVKVLDFGLVKDVEAPADPALSSADTIKGTPLYLAPESLTDPETVDGRTDLYALGAVAYFLLVAEPVFQGKTTVEVLGHHLHSAPVPLREKREALDGDLEAVVMRCLEKDPSARFQTAAEFATALRACAAAGSWSSSDARRWWDETRENIQTRRDETAQPTELRIAPG